MQRNSELENYLEEMLFFQVVTDYPKTFEVFPDYQRHSHCQYFGTANSICKGET